PLENQRTPSKVLNRARPLEPPAALLGRDARGGDRETGKPFVSQREHDLPLACRPWRSRARGARGLMRKRARRRAPSSPPSLADAFPAQCRARRPPPP